MEEEIQVHWSPMSPHIVLRNHISVLMVFTKGCEYPYWDGLQPRVFISSFVTKSMPSRSLLIPFPGMQRWWIQIFTIFNCRKNKNQNETNFLNKFKIVVILQWFQMCKESSVEMVPRRYTGSCSEGRSSYLETKCKLNPKEAIV